MHYGISRRAAALAALAVLFGAVLGGGAGRPALAEAPATPIITLDALKAGWNQAEKAVEPPRTAVKGIYLTSYTATHEGFNELMALIGRTELNAMVVNVKDDWGNITFDADIPLAKEAGAIHPDFSDLKAWTAQLKAKHVYSIARIVTFKDANVPKDRPDLAVHSTRGGIWRDYNSVTWLNPYSRDAWDYVVSIGKAAALAGFDEIQFDYVRFPTDGEMSTLSYPGQDSRPKQQVIGDFLAYARKELHPYGVWVSADAFGFVTSFPDDQGIGQRFEEMSAGVDYLSPMVYPSHYTPGNLGLANPNAMPYQTVFRSMSDAKARLAKAGLTGQVTMRPWLQDFSWGYPYGPDEVKAQIQATYDAGYNEWILWNAANVYSEAALRRE